MKIVRMDKKIFEKAFDLANQHLDKNYIITALKGDNDIEKQISLLKITDIETKEEANLVIQHLTGHDGPVREAAAIKVRELILEKNNKIFDDIDYYTKYAEAVCDVNPNICRAVIDFLPVLFDRKNLTNILFKKIQSIFERIDKPDTEQKNFLTVRLFNIYWCLEAVSELLSEEFDDADNILNNILLCATPFSDYTINEKVAKILTKTQNFKDFDKIKKDISDSGNFYVKRYLKE